MVSTAAWPEATLAASPRASKGNHFSLESAGALPAPRLVHSACSWSELCVSALESSHFTTTASRPLRAAQVLSATTATPVGIWKTSTTPGTFFAAVASNEATFAPNFGAWATMAVSILGRWTSWVKRAVPVLLAVESLRRTRSVPIRVKVLGSFSVGFCGGVTFAAAVTSSPKCACLPVLAWETTPFWTVTSPAGTAQVVAAAWTNMARAAAPAARSCGQELEIAEEPPVPCMPKPVLA